MHHAAAGHCDIFHSAQWRPERELLVMLRYHMRDRCKSLAKGKVRLTAVYQGHALRACPPNDTSSF